MSLVSIIIPTWNVEQYLRSCLESIEAQTHADLQVLIVDDESTDASPYIAGQFADKDSRFQHIRQANRGPGPGGGRNGGLPFVEGEWIFFLDSDDLIPPDAIEKLHAVGTRSGSDIVSGNVGRLRSDGNVWPTSNHSRSHAFDMTGTHILRHPVLIYDTTAWNKLYRTEFWNGADRTFPERKLFEDIDPITRAHCESASTDIIADQVYLWRVRDDQTSITQQVADERTFRDKIEQMTLAHDYLCENGYDQVRATFEEKSLTRDFLQGVDDVAHGDDAYAKMVCTEGAEFLERMLPASLQALPRREQLKFHLARNGRLDDLRDLLTGAYDDAPCTLHLQATPPRAQNDFAASLRPAVPDDLTTSDDTPTITLSRVFIRWDSDDIVVTATAAVAGLGGPLAKVEDLQLTCRDHTRSVPATMVLQSPLSDGVRGIVDSLQLDRNRRTARLAPFGRFVARLSLADLRPGNDADVVRWGFHVSLTASGIARSARLPVLAESRLPADPVRELDGFRYEFTSNHDVTLTVRRMS